MDPDYFDPDYFGELLGRDGPTVSPYFDCVYFDQTYFDTPGCAPVSGGGHHVVRRRQLVVRRQPDDDFWLMFD